MSNIVPKIATNSAIQERPVRLTNDKQSYEKLAI